MLYNEHATDVTLIMCIVFFCTGLSEPFLLAYPLSTNSSYTDLFIFIFKGQKRFTN